MERHRATQSNSSSEIGSDEDYDYLVDDYAVDNGMPMDVDMEFDEFTSESESESESDGTGGSPADELTSSPAGVDLDGSSEPISILESSTIVEEYLGAAKVIEERKNLFTQIWEDDELHESRKIGGPYYPFSGYMEWEMVEWLHSLHVPMEKIDRFFELAYVSLDYYYTFHFTLILTCLFRSNADLSLSLRHGKCALVLNFCLAHRAGRKLKFKYKAEAQRNH